MIRGNRDVETRRRCFTIAGCGFLNAITNTTKTDDLVFVKPCHPHSDCCILLRNT